VTEIRAGPRAALALQFPAWDYFPGPRIGDPVPMDDLEPLSMAEVKASTWPKAPLDRLKEAAKLTDANLIVDVDDTGGFIHVEQNVLVPGLVLDLKISTGDAAGITGYLPPVKSPTKQHSDLLLAHNPKLAPLGAAAGFDLQLSGHTHAGQFFPWTLAIHLVHAPHVSGLSRSGRMWVYVSAGTGTWGPPVRFGSQPELTLTRLARAA
jgi:predicted MPP superfamily phosphohydrolase